VSARDPVWAAWLACGLAAACTAEGCTFEDGRGFGRVERVTVEARVPGAVLETSRGALVELLVFDLDVGAIELESSGSASTEPATEDEHGHDHGDDGAALDAASAERWVVVIPAAFTLDALSGEPVDADAAQAEPSRELGPGMIDRVHVDLERARIVARATAAGPGGPPLDIVVDRVVGGELSATTMRALSRDRAHEIALDLEILIPATLFDGVDLADAPAVSEAVAARLLASELHASFEGHEHEHDD